MPSARQARGNDLREGGQWTCGQRAKNHVILAVVRGALATGRHLPERIARRVGRGLGWLVWALANGWRRRANEQLRAAGIALSARGVFVSLGELLGEAVCGLHPTRPLRPLPFLPGARETLDAALREGRGVLFASAHLGPWERVARTLAAEGYPLTVVAREPYDPRLLPVYHALRRGISVVYRGAPGAGVAMMRVLRRGGLLGIPMDLRSRVPSAAVAFLGRPAPTPTGPATLALRSGAAIVVGTVAADGGGGLGVSFERIPTSGADAVVATTRINEALSARIRALPLLWPWMHHRWEPLPDGGSRPKAAGRSRPEGREHEKVVATGRAGYARLDGR